MTQIQNILVGVDLHHGDRMASAKLGEESQAAVTEALQLATTWGGSLTFCAVLELSAQSQSLIEQDHQNIFRTVEDIAAEILAGLITQAKEKGIEAKSLVRFGAAWEELSKESARHDLIILGTRQKVKASQVLFGSTAQKVMRFASCPVWVVKPDEVRTVRDVAVASDLSAGSLPAMRLAVTVARAINARLHVLHVLELADFRYLTLAGVPPDSLGRTEDRLHKTAADKLQAQLHQTDFRTLSHGTKVEVLKGVSDVEIPEYVQKEKIDLLVIGSHGHSGVAGIFLGNTAERILPSVHASLLVVKPDGFRSPYAT